MENRVFRSPSQQKVHGRTFCDRNKLKLTKLTDYGMLLMTRLAASDQSIWTAPELAAATALPAPTVRKLLQSLLRRHLLISQRGARGGYRLARRPQEISLREVVDALEGGVTLTECNSDRGQCDRQSDCTMRAGWQRINEAMRELLDSITLAELARPDFAPRFVRVATIPVAQEEATSRLARKM
ncbi:MAG: SUF system Fe-S cluster assembly regulator [Zetaproteobacteria bacterium]|nr:MAG: SUF system Fe-S cluster assembly regulator [Zetaproteobacteria bacterium]